MPKNVLKLLAAGCAGLLLAACGGDAGNDAQPAAGAGKPAAPAAPPEPDYDLDALLASADVKRGQMLYLQCRACHSLEQGGENKVGPNLWGIFGQTAGEVPGFGYSDALKASGVVWTDETMDAWIRRPADVIPGTNMVFVGIRDSQERANVIAYLKQETGAAE